MGEKRCINCMKLMPDTERTCPHCGFIEEYVEESYRSAGSHYLPIRHKLNGDRYQVGRMIGEGGFGIVYIGWDDRFGQVVAIKEFYSRQFVESREMSVRITPYKDTEEQYRAEIERVKKEARAIKQFAECPGIVRVEDFFEENNTVYLVMAYVEGITLAQYMKKNAGGIDGAQCLEKFRPIIKSLHTIHKMGMLHRDISLDNIMVQKDNSLKLMDFGAARPMDARTSSVTVKYGYGPKEQYNVTKDNQGPWIDVYALCVCLWNCLTGKTMKDSGERECEEDRGDVWKDSKVSGLSREQKDTIRKGLELDYKKRLQSMDELYYGLYKGKIDPDDRDEKYNQPAPSDSAIKRTIRKIAANSGRVAAIALAICVVGGGIAWGIWYWRSEQDTDSIESTSVVESQSDSEEPTPMPTRDAASEEKQPEPSGAEGTEWKDAEGNLYNCDRVNGLANGRGICDYVNGDHYEGDFVGGRREGEGTLWYAEDDSENREKYDGEWKKDMPYGTGTISWIDGASYDGNWVDGVMEGNGTYWFAEKDEQGRERYEGEWKDGKKDGTGILYFENGASYDGEWADDAEDGKGVYWYAEDAESGKEKYDGQWKEGVRSGKGVLTYREDSKRLQFIGEFAEDQWNGEGVLYFKDGVRCEGTWIDGKEEGTVVHWYSAEDERLKYVGEYKDDGRNGLGTLYWKNGYYWEGEWKDDVRKGNGILWYPEDDSRLKYVGTWDADNSDGVGVMYYRDGTFEAGIWKDGVLQGAPAEEETWEDNGNTYTGCRVNGMLQGIGKVEAADGTIGGGEYLNGLHHGSFCTDAYPDGSSFEGKCLYVCGGFYSEATFSYPDGRKYVGIMEGNVPNGFGIYYGDGYMEMGYYKDGVYQMNSDWVTWTEEDGTIYTGTQVNGVIDGEGIALYGSGARFEGEFAMGVWKSGTYYFDENSDVLYVTGEMRDGSLNGESVWVYADGRRYEGEAVMGTMEGIGTMYYTDGRIESGIWKKNEYQGTDQE